MPRQLVQLYERAGVEQHLDSFPRGLLAPRVLLLHRPSRSGVYRLVRPVCQICDLSGGRVDVDVVLELGCGHAAIVNAGLRRVCDTRRIGPLAAVVNRAWMG